MPSINLKLSFTSLLLVSYSTFSQEILSNWKLTRESDDIKISYRFIKVADTLKTREMCLSFFVKATPNKIVPMFKEADNLTAWSVGIKKCKVLRDNNSTWLTYTKYNFPWPFKQEDLITEYSMAKSNSIVTLSYKSGTPNQLPYYESISITQKYEGKWLFIPLENGTTKVEFHSIALYKSSIPKFIQDPIVQDILIESIHNLKTLLSVQESKRIIAFE